MKVDCLTFTYGLPYSFWDKVNIVFYNVIPFLIMITFNSLLIMNIKRSNVNHSQNPKLAAKKRNLTISLLSLCFLFLIMTVPSTIVFAFFYDFIFSYLGLKYVYMFDDISFLNNCILFFVCFSSNRKFRKTVFRLVQCQFGKMENEKT